MTRRIVVTGGTGFIGREAVAALGGEELHLISRTGGAPAGCTGHALDLLSDDSAPLLRDIAPTHLLHLAWHVPPGQFWSAPENLDWVAASLRLIRAFADAGGRRAVYAGTCAEYDWSHEELDEERTPLRPATLYGESKAVLYRLLVAAAPALGLSVACGRIFFPYGPEEPSGRLFSSLIDGFMAGEPVPCSDGTQVRDFIHAENVGRAFAALLTSEIEGAVNIGSGEGHSVREFAEAAAEAANATELPMFGARPRQAGEPQRLVARTERLSSIPGYVPAYGFRDGIADAVRRRMNLPK